ncbi:hypothetical protein [Thermomonospora umbrina]|uniref:hypothetical protein n=1 Tax=Thermomonospora umbrina TaxID=111806 RepID=UPI000E260525|nr:hypothetical protein [Thermomonospora umbrina]
MNTKLRRSAVGVMVAVSVVSMAAPAEAAPGWRITATPDRNAGLRGLAVTGPNSAWAAGYQSVNSEAVPVVRRWNGKTWQRMPLPASVKGAYLHSVSATSNTNVWISGSNGRRKQYWMRWNGKRWAVVTGELPEESWPHSPRLLAVGAGDVWSFGRAGAGPIGPDVRHYNGRRWRRVKAPGLIVRADAVSGKDVWATGWTPGERGPIPTVMRWNGTSWRKQAQPLGVRATGTVAGGVLALGSKNVWVAGADSTGRGLLLRWNGKTWSKRPAPIKGTLSELVDDGNGGLWMLAGRRLVHYKAGKWTTRAVPGRTGLQTEIGVLARVPKTTSIWAVGALVDKKSIDKSSVVLKYGK